MSDSEFLMWLHERLKSVHGENESIDYMVNLRRIAAEICDSQYTDNRSKI